MLKLDVFLSRLMPSANGCTEPLARQAILDSAIEFCEETGIVRVTTDPAYPQSGNPTYEVDLPSELKVVTVLRAWYGAQELIPAPDSQVSQIAAYAPSQTVSQDQAPTYFLEGAPGEVTVYPTPGGSVTEKLFFRVSTKPARMATTVDNVLFDNWVEPIVAGALARLQATPDTPFFNAGASAHQAGLFRLGVNRARSEAVRGRVRTSISVAPRAFH